MNISIYFDGGCRAKHGGYAAVACSNDNTFQVYVRGGQEETTNNQMELKGFIYGVRETVKCLNKLGLAKGANITVYGDSEYVLLGVGGRLAQWQATGKLEKKANVPLWLDVQRTLDVCAKLGVTLTFEHVKGHTGVPGNELVDKMCTNVCTSKLVSHNVMVKYRGTTTKI